MSMSVHILTQISQAGLQLTALQLGILRCISLQFRKLEEAQGLHSQNEK